MNKRATTSIALAVAAVTTLGACKSLPPPPLYARNDANEPIVFRVEFTETDQTWDDMALTGDDLAFTLEECEWARAEVSTTDGRLRAEIHQTICPNWKLWVDEDLVLHYFKNTPRQQPHLTVSLAGPDAHA
ncbi:hypothetical protein [Cellulosimicrobium cellulans]|uniref:hypothetical protein n=1 Tax=Cellulosimicrobium cellulans TaxID=1710 RepID=UPI00130E0741|nr:hypothetical protein [Cellulosimicrobium cellulans]